MEENHNKMHELRESVNRSLESSANRSTSIEGHRQSNVPSVADSNRVVEVDENFKKYMNNLHRYMETGTIKTPEKQKEGQLSDI
tara:strand:- start:184 stop:435 length:252 start_codon:yes stop_codon:yes gene_type:complete